MSTYTKDKSQKRAKVIAIAVIAVVLVFALWVASFLLTPVVREMGAQSLADSVLARANQCYAIEGSYPSSLTYLEDNYGLVVNRNDYVVVYESFADNIAPKVMVTPRA